MRCGPVRSSVRSSENWVTRKPRRRHQVVVELRQRAGRAPQAAEAQGREALGMTGAASLRAYARKRPL